MKGLPLLFLSAGAISALAGMAWGQILGLGCLGDAYSLLKHMAGML